MPVQQQMASFAKTLGGRVAQVNAEHKDKPVDTGDRRLPSGIRDGIAKLSTMYTKVSESDDSKTPKGQVFFRASAIVVSPQEFNGEKIAGLVTQQVIPLCDIPAKGNRKAVSLSKNWFEFQNIFKLLGVPPCPETTETDPTGQKTEAYFMTWMKALTDPNRLKTNPVYVSFSTRGWTPPATPQQPKPNEMVFETWHGLATYNPQHDPAAGVQDNLPPTPGTAPVMPREPFNEFTPPPAVNGTPTHMASAAAPTQLAPTTPPLVTAAQAPDLADQVAAWVEVAMNDPEGATEEGQIASAHLEQAAWAAGWTQEQTANPPAPYSNDWAGVGDMALNKPPAAAPVQTAPPVQTPPPATNGVNAAVPPMVGGKWYFAKRTKDGAKLKNNQGVEFPAQECVVATVDPAAKTCTLKTAKDSKDVVDIRTKQPVAVKWEWLQTAP